MMQATTWERSADPAGDATTMPKPPSPNHAATAPLDAADGATEARAPDHIAESLRRLFGDVEREELPEKLKALLAELAAAERGR